MFKKLSALLSVLLVLCMVFCMAGCDKGDVNSNSTPDSSQPTSTPESDTTSTDSDTTSDATSSEDKKEDKEESKTSTPSKPAGPTAVDPKTNIKLDKYYAGEFLSADGKTYGKLNFSFHDGGEYGYSYTYSLTSYYTKEYCTERLGGLGMEFSEDEYAEYSITVKGVKYYTIDFLNMGSAHTCEFTDNAIILSDDENEIATLSLLSDGTLVVKSIKNEKYGPVGTVFTLKNE